MAALLTSLRWILRIAFLIALILGIALWTGHATAYLSLHMWLGFIITFDLLLLVILAFLSGVSVALPFLSLIWAVLLPVIGIAQLKVMLGASHWVIQVIHVLLGIGSIGLGEVLAGRILVRRASR